MRLPVVPQISTKDGTSNRNARLTNCLKESKKGGDKAVVRPGLVLSDTYAGLGNGLIEFDGRLLVVYDDTVTDVEEDSFPWPLDSDQWASGTTYDFGDAVWYNGNMWFSTEGSNTGNTPGTGTEWAMSYEIPEWDSGTTYAIGDPVTYGGVTYYSMSPSNTGQNPSTSPQWRITAPTASRWQVGLKLIAALNATTPGPECASAEAAASAWFATATTYISCATKFPGPNTYVTFVGTGFSSPYYYAKVNQWVDDSPGDCSGTQVNLGVIDGGRIIKTA